MLCTVGWLLIAAGCAASADDAGVEDCVGAACVDGCVAAIERCDGVDNDCDGAVDEEASDGATWYADRDADGYGDVASAVVSCDAPEGSIAAGGDCDDDDRAVHPAAAETCNDRDDDCDGAVDDADADVTDTCGDVDTGGGVGASVPGELLDLTNWKLTLPIGAADDASSPAEITQPELDDYAIDPWFQLTSSGDGVLFRANAGGVTTSNSGYPRSELREMADGGASRADWSTTSGVHTMTITQAITHLPEVKPHVVVGQIHDADDDVVMIRLEGDHLFVEGAGENLGDLDSAYVLGEPFTVRMVAAEGWIDVYYEDLSTPAVSISRDTDGCYFKAGAYAQSNTDRGDAPEAYAEVEIQALAVTHE